MCVCVRVCVCVCVCFSSKLLLWYQFYFDKQWQWRSSHPKWLTGRINSVLLVVLNYFFPNGTPQVVLCCAPVVRMYKLSQQIHRIWLRFSPVVEDSCEPRLPGILKSRSSVTQKSVRPFQCSKKKRKLNSGALLEWHVKLKVRYWDQREILEQWIDGSRSAHLFPVCLCST